MIQVQVLSVDQKQILKDLYYACFQVVIHGIGIYTEGSSERVQLFFDKRPKTIELAGQLFNRCTQELDIGERLISLNFVPSNIVLPLQAADLLAYELNRYRGGSGKLAESRWFIKEIAKLQGRYWFDFFDHNTRTLQEFIS
jgi:hypothetical protein